MQVVGVILQALHILSSSLWVAASLLFVFVFHPVWVRYYTYTLFTNFRLEFVQLLLKGLNGALAISIISGVGLIGIFQRNVLAGTYGVLFTLKMVLLLLSFYLLQPWFKVIDEQGQPTGLEKLKNIFNFRSVMVLITNTLLVFIAVYGKNATF